MAGELSAVVAMSTQYPTRHLWSGVGHEMAVGPIIGMLLFEGMGPVIHLDHKTESWPQAHETPLESSGHESVMRWP